MFILDIIVFSNEYSILIGINGGGGNFISLDTVSYEIGAQDFVLADLDNDEDIDIVFQLH